MNQLQTHKDTYIKIADYYEDRCNNLGGPFYLLSATTIETDIVSLLNTSSIAKDKVIIKNGEDKKYYNQG